MEDAFYTSINTGMGSFMDLKIRGTEGTLGMGVRKKCTLRFRMTLWSYCGQTSKRNRQNPKALMDRAVQPLSSGAWVTWLWVTQCVFVFDQTDL